MSITGTEKQFIPSYPLPQGRNGNDTIVVREAAGEPQPRGEDFLIPHRKDYYLLVLVRDGNSRHWVDATPYTLQQDTFYFTTPQQVHLKEDMQPMQGMIACFTEDFLQIEADDILRALPIIQNPADAHELLLTQGDVAYIDDVMRKMLAEYATASNWRNSMLASWLRILLLYLSRLYTAQYGNVMASPNYNLLKQFQSLTSEHSHHIHDVATYAQMLHISAGHLSDVVKQQSGKTAMAHIHNRLAVEAKRRLLHTELNVKQIANELGFEDAAYFNRFFKRMTSVSPATYRMQIRKMYH